MNIFENTYHFSLNYLPCHIILEIATLILNITWFTSSWSAQRPLLSQSGCLPEVGAYRMCEWTNRSQILRSRYVGSLLWANSCFDTAQNYAGEPVISTWLIVKTLLLVSSDNIILSLPQSTHLEPSFSFITYSLLISLVTSSFKGSRINQFFYLLVSSFTQSQYTSFLDGCNCLLWASLPAFMFLLCQWPIPWCLVNLP